MENQVTGAAITDSLIIMALGMTLASTLALAIRANGVRRQDLTAVTTA